MTTLTDSEIRKLMDAGQLIYNGNLARIGPASYELRASGIYYDLTVSDRPIDAAATGGVILIKPGHRVVLITMESLVVPSNVLARIASKGSLFSVGLSPVSTYADPGFEGQLGLVTQNSSDKYLVLPIGEPVAKVDFSTLTAAVSKPYRGQHGYGTQVWPIRYDLQKTYDEVKHYPGVLSESAEANKIIPAATATALAELKGNQIKVNIGLVFALAANTIMYAVISNKALDISISIFTNLISSALIGLLLYIQQKKS
ncbi:hypothetical protein M5C97_21970 [Acidovorax sp. NCPPB 3859]|nr:MULTISPECIES: hypothetical protein [unclassified Acidovorax]MDA8452295.1 hypothetical protein [Acidovorax sp. GBBC 3297]MDA8461741.1 hypothetical protein [Acidovorax sp. GBBC 3333]MDA8466774.1 hypothetical protein [Acidovorax sp. GBBC 3332]MDA8471812.1 hypothetical protein [Acidovorax sp. GBBC 3299]WCM78136.1 hypothetical protein M5C94_21915 [Acidovorax sp. GBBC 712]